MGAALFEKVRLLQPRLVFVDALRSFWPRADGKTENISPLVTLMETHACVLGRPCSHLAMKGAAPVAIQRLAGHQDSPTTRHYVHPTPEALDDAIRLLEPTAAIGAWRLCGDGGVASQ